jgi:hypothetical protein
MTVTQKYATEAARKAGNAYRLQRDYFPHLSHASIWAWVNGKSEARAANLEKLRSIAESKRSRGMATIGAMLMTLALSALPAIAHYCGAMYIMSNRRWLTTGLWKLRTDKDLALA